MRSIHTVLLSSIVSIILTLLVIVAATLWIFSTSQNNFKSNHQIKYQFIHQTGIHRAHEHPVNVLVVSGGGVMGLIPLTVLRYLEKKSGRKLSSSIDLFVGTSTGAVIVATLDKKITHQSSDTHDTRYVLDQYFHMIPSLFNYNLWYRIKTLNGLVGPLFKSQHLSDSLKRIFGESQFSEMKKPLVFIGFDLNHAKIVNYSSWKTKAVYAHTPVYQLLSGATSAPLIFPPFPIYYPNQKKPHVIVDGAVAANNPELIGYFIARRLYPNRYIRVISLGDGSYKEILAPYLNSLGSIGLLSWAKVLGSIFIHSHSLLVREYMSDLIAIPGSKLVDFYRINMSVPSKDFSAFNGSLTHLNLLNWYGRQLIQHEKVPLDQLALLLKQS